MSPLATTHVRTGSRARVALGLMMGAFAAAMPIAVNTAGAEQRPATSTRSTSLVESAALAETARAPYQAFLYPPDCVPNSNICRLTSEVVRRRRRLEIRQLACQGVHSGNLFPTVTGIIDIETAAGAFVQRINLLEGRYMRNSGSTLAAWTISQPTLMFIPASHRMKITISTGSPVNSSSGCTISGYLVTLD